VVAEASGAGLIAALADLAGSGAIRLSVAAADAVAAERLRRRMPQGEGVDVLALSAGVAACADVVMAMATPGADWSALARLLRTGGALVAFARCAMRCTASCLVRRLAVMAGPTWPPSGPIWPGSGTAFASEDDGVVVHVATRRLERGVAVNTAGLKPPA
jgi:hypothetical protein